MSLQFCRWGVNGCMSVFQTEGLVGSIPITCSKIIIMNKCLNCGKEVNNKFCNTSCQNQYKSKQIRLKYEENPNVCQHCNKALSWEQRKNKYCSISCAASANNTNLCCNTTSFVTKWSDEEFITILNSSNNWVELGINLGYNNNLSSNVKKSILNRCKDLKIEWHSDNITTPIKSRTKKDIFTLSKNWQSARSNIRRDAYKNYFKENKNPKCKICGYDKHIEVAHIKAVSEFSDDTLISEINDINNLVGLCPNHHWEYDHGLLKL